MLSLTLTRELGSFSRLMISAFGNSVLLLLSEGAGQVCQSAHLHIEKAIIVTAGGKQYDLHCRKQRNIKKYNVVRTYL